jgi:leucyl-tRNA---protein transferase
MYLRRVLVQTASIFNISRETYDEFLASGWFRGYGILYKSEFLCLDQELLSAVNIRLDLEKHHWRKGQRKLLSYNDRRFRVVIGKIRITKEKQRLYDIQKTRFKAFVHDSLEEVVRGFSAHRFFNTHELCVYQGRRLVAVSYFDIGYKAVASILCLFNPDYAPYSPGIFTMLKEIEYARSLGMKYYYPGYVMDLSESFHYKLRVGEVDWLTPQFTWQPWSSFHPSLTKAHVVRQQTIRLANYLQSLKIPFTRKLYPYYSAGHIMQTDAHLVRYPIFLEWKGKDKRRIAAYDIESEQFITGTVRETPEYDFLLNPNYTSEYLENPVYQLGLYLFEEFNYFLLDTPAQGAQQHFL